MSQIQKRKDEHLRVCLEKDVESGISTGLQNYSLEYDALPEVDLEEVDLTTKLFGKTLQAPILIGSMTGGSELAGELNIRLAKVAAKLGIGLGLGSQRAMLSHPDVASTFAVRNQVPNLPLLLGNIGAVQLAYGVTHEDLKMLVESVNADGLYFHFNPLQEAIQPEGDTRFSGLFERLKQAIDAMPFPCLAKEVGAGISQKTATKLAKLPFAGIEASGVGGTSWARVEGYRSSPQSRSARMGESLRAFGTPTALSIRYCREAFEERPVIGSGGIRTAMDIAVSIALGADAVAIARPVLEAVTKSEATAEQYLSDLIHELRVICFCTGVKSLKELREVNIIRRGQ